MILNCGSLLQTILALPNCMAAASAAFSRNIRVFWLTVTRSQRQFKTMIIIYDEIVKHLNWFFFLICSINYQLPQHKKLIIDAGALPCLVDLLRRHKSCPKYSKKILRVDNSVRKILKEAMPWNPPNQH